MSDLISRKEVIELLTSRVLSSKGIYGDLGGAVSGVRELIKAMPSAEEEAFEWCHDCKEYDQENYCCHRWTKVIRQTVEEMKAESERKWIPVTEALPKPWQEVLTTYEYNGKRFVQTAEYAGQKDEKGNPLFCSYSDEFAPDHYDFVYVAWQPLPEPWRGE